MIETIRKTGRALADENRIRILLALAKGKERCVCELTEMLALAAATVSRHAAILLEAGLVEARKEGRWVYYRSAGPERLPIPEETFSWIVESCEKDPKAVRDRNFLKKRIPCKE